MKRTGRLASVVAAALALAMIFSLMPAAVDTEAASTVSYVSAESLVAYSGDETNAEYEIYYPTFQNFDAADTANALTLGAVADIIGSYKDYVGDSEDEYALNGSYTYETYGDLLSFSIDCAIFKDGERVEMFGEPFVIDMKTGELYDDLTKLLSTRKNISEFNAELLSDITACHDDETYNDDEYTAVKDCFLGAKGHLRFSIVQGCIMVGPTSAMLRRNELICNGIISKLFYPLGKYSDIAKEFTSAQAEYLPDFDYTSHMPLILLDGEPLLSYTDTDAYAENILDGMFPVGTIAKAIGYDVMWDEDSTSMLIASPTGKAQAVVTPGSDTAQNADGDEIKLSAATVKTDSGDILVPADFFGSVMDYVIINSGIYENIISWSTESYFSTLTNSFTFAKSAKELVEKLNAYAETGNIYGEFALCEDNARSTIYQLIKSLEESIDKVGAVDAFKAAENVKVSFKLIKNGTKIEMAVTNSKLGTSAKSICSVVEKAGVFTLDIA